MTDLISAEKKRITLEGILRKMGSVVIAYSGGVDSSYLLYSAASVLGAEHVIAATARSPIYVEQDEDALGALPKQLGVRLILLRAEQLEDAEFVHNPQDRCYYCKRGVLAMLARFAAEEKIRWMAEGSNLDDRADWRPGVRAVQEAGVRSPLLEAELTKSEIRELARRAGLPNWNKPAESCLAARFPYGERITPEGLERVRKSEAVLKEMGFHSVRVRHYGTMARIEVAPEEVARLTAPVTAARVTAALRANGYQYVAADLLGYRSGSLNETLPAAKGDQPNG
jgi:pyridinium-3,5-biscarboxylic acid mononucleotide sulfurtransferase